ncbi:hypothetical protein B0H11DRAFT_2229905 [Mycena galericulata]|nr:hypothetical protein B0H11DRAFT_2229905 [Mycena galericulata]
MPNPYHLNLGSFWKGELYGNNKTHKEARCREEVALELAKRKEAQMEKIRQGAMQPGEALPDSKLHEQALKAVKPICGKIKNLSKHIRECESVRAQWKTKLAAKENGESDSDDIASPETSTAVGQKNKRQATFELVPGAKRFKITKRTLSPTSSSFGQLSMRPLILLSIPSYAIGLRSGCQARMSLGVKLSLGAFWIKRCL